MAAMVRPLATAGGQQSTDAELWGWAHQEEEDKDGPRGLCWTS